MNEQLSLFELVGDSKIVSPTVVGDTENQSIQRYLNRVRNTPCHIETYNPNGGKTKYYRLKYRLGRTVKTIEIKGGNCSARLAAMIDRDAELSEVLEQLADFNGGTSKAARRLLVGNLPTQNAPCKIN